MSAAPQAIDGVAAPCSHAEHRERGLDWQGEHGRLVCGVCHPRPKAAAEDFDLRNLIEGDPGPPPAPPVDEDRAEVSTNGAGPREQARPQDGDRPPRPDRWSDGGAFILDAPDKVPAVWGRDDDVLWPKGEPLMIAAPPGLGKTTIGQQLALALAGVGSGQLLGLPVSPAAGKVAYIAADRPAQAARSFRRMVGEEDRATLAERLTVWRGPLPFDLASDPGELVPFLQSRGIAAVVIDSLGAVALDLASDEAGSRVFAALGAATAMGIEVGVLHHDRKREQGSERVRTLDDVYGSRWITAAVGSVLYLDGKAGDPVPTLRHLKQPAAEFGPVAIRHDHEAGRTTLDEPTDLLEIVAEGGADGTSVKAAAGRLFETADPTRNEIEKARRRLEKLADRGDLERITPNPGDPTLYRRP